MYVYCKDVGWQLNVDVVWYIHNICINVVENVELCWIDYWMRWEIKWYTYIYLYLLRMLNCVEWSDGIWCEEMLVCWNVSYAHLCELIENCEKWIEHEVKCGCWNVSCMLWILTLWVQVTWGGINCESYLKWYELTYYYEWLMHMYIEWCEEM